MSAVRETVVSPPKTYAIMKLADGWHRWCHATFTWQPLPEYYRHGPEQAAREYAAGYYGVPARQVEIQMQPDANCAVQQASA